MTFPYTSMTPKILGDNTKDVTAPPSPVVTVPTEKSKTKDIELDIEHIVVQDDPRRWSTTRKTFTLAIVATASLIATLGVNIYNPAINDIQTQLHATNQEISLSLSIFIIFQGATPLLWSAVSEIRGRKFVYLASISLYLVGCSVAASAQSMWLLISMRIVQAMGGSAVLAIGAATLADIYEPCQRGAIVGIFYAAPLLGPSLGPLIGGLATQLFSWRATFYVLVIFAGISLVTFIFFKDTFRRERSLSYQNALLAMKRREKNRQAQAPKVRQLGSENRKTESENGQTESEGGQTESKNGETETGSTPDLEAHPEPTLLPICLSLRDINPIRPLIPVLRRLNNLTMLFSSGLLFGFTYCVTYTAARTFGAAPYNFDALKIGLLLLPFGVGSIFGSVLGGKWSDHVLSKIRTANGGKMYSEDRLRSTKPMVLVLPPSLLAYAWMAQYKIHVAGLCPVLFLIGFSSIWIYSTTLAYLVDANAGRSSTAVATNSFFRGFTGFVAAEVAIPLQDVLGDGGLYSIWAGLMVIVCILIMLTIAKGGKWREMAEEREAVSNRKG